MKKIHILFIACAMALPMVSCNSKSESDTVTATESSSDTDPVDFNSGDRMISPKQLDELILNPDDLTSGEAVGALYYLHTLIQQSTNGVKRDETMRKFVDLYGIVMDINSDNIHTAIRKLQSAKGVDLQSIYEDYRTTLQVGDEVAPGADELDENAADATITTVNDETEQEAASSTTAPTTSPATAPEATSATAGE